MWEKGSDAQFKSAWYRELNFMETKGMFPWNRLVDCWDLGARGGGLYPEMEKKMFNNHRNNNWCRPKWLNNLGFEDLYTVLTVPSMIHMGFEGFADSLHFPLPIALL